MGRMRLIGLMGLMVVSAVGAQAATVVVPVLHYTGSTNLRPFTIKLTSQEPVSYGSNLVFGTPLRVTPTNALQEVRLLPATYTILFDGASTPVAFAVPDGTNTYYLNDLVTRGITLLVAADSLDANAISSAIGAKLSAVRGTGSNLFLNGEIFFGGTNLHGDARVFADPDSGDFRIWDSRGDIGLALHHDTLRVPWFQGTDPAVHNLWEVRDPDTFEVKFAVDTNGVSHANLAGGTNLPMAGVNGLSELSNRVHVVETAGGGAVTNAIAVTGNTTNGSYVTLWTNAPAGSNWVATIGVTVVGSGPVNRYVEEITWSVVCSNGVTWVDRTNDARAVVDFAAAGEVRSKSLVVSNSAYIGGSLTAMGKSNTVGNLVTGELVDTGGAYLSHSNNWDSAKYALRQTPDGTTRLNAASGQAVQLGVAGSAITTVTSSGLGVNTNSPKAALHVFGSVLVTGGYALYASPTLPTNQIPPSTSALTNYVLVNWTNTGPVFVATNIAGAGRFLVLKPTMTLTTYP